MTKQRKHEKKAVIAKQFSDLHKQGQKGPKSTTPKHEKKAANRVYTVRSRSLKEFQEVNKKGKKAMDTRPTA